MTLPSPLELGALATMAAVGAGLVLFFLKNVTGAFYLGIAAAILFLCASVAYGYERMGEAKIQPKLDHALAQLKQLDDEATQFKSDAINARDAAAHEVMRKQAIIASQAATIKGLLDAQDSTVSNTAVPAAAGVFLNSRIAEANSAALGASAGDAARAAASVSAASTVRQWEEWGAAVTGLYGQCASTVVGLQSYVAGLNAASARATPVN